MKELKAWRLTLENKETHRRSCVYHVCETIEEAKEEYEKNWNRFQYLVRIDDITQTTKGCKLIKSHTYFEMA